MAYSIVEFIQSEEVEVVPTKWLFANQLTLKCHWPPYKGGRMRKAVILEEDPDKSWSLYDVRLIKPFETYDEARAKLTYAENTDNLDTDSSLTSSNTTIRCSKRKRILKKFSSSSDEDSESNEAASVARASASLPPPVDFPNHMIENEIDITRDVPSQTSIAAPSARVNSLLSLQGPPALPSSPTSFFKTPTRNMMGVTRDVQSPNSFAAPSARVNRFMSLQGPPASPSSPTSFLQSPTRNMMDCFTKIAERLESLHAVQEQHSIMLLELLNNSRISLDVGSISRPEGMPNLPLHSVEELEAFEGFLKLSKTNYGYALKLLTTVGGGTIPQSTRRIAKRLLTSELAQHFNWAGRAPKRPFKVLVSASLIVDAVKKCHPESSTGIVGQIEEAIKDWLKYACLRVLSAQKKQLN